MRNIVSLGTRKLSKLCARKNLNKVHMAEMLLSVWKDIR